MGAALKYAVVTVAMLALCGQAHAQATGKFTPGHGLRVNSTSGAYSDAGSAHGSDIFGFGYITELGITNKGLPFCINDALTSGPYHQFCFGNDTLGNAVLSLQSFNGAVSGTFKCLIDGATKDCFGGGLSPIVGNSVLGNKTGSSALPVALGLPDCPDSSGKHLNYTTGTGFFCGTGGGGGGVGGCLMIDGTAGNCLLITASTTDVLLIQ